MSKKKSFSKGKMRGREQMPVFPFVLAACLMLVIDIGASYIIPAEKADGDVPVVISEVMTANRATWPNEDGVFCDWVELYNSSEDTSCNLTGWHVSGNLDSRGTQDCGAGIIEPGGYRVVYLDGGNKDSALSSNGASIYLTDARGNIRSALEVPALAKGESYALSGDGVYSTVETPTPGAENTRSAWENMLKAEELDCGIYINEVMASGQKTLPDRDGEITDYIELCNATDSAADLSGWYLTDDISDRHAFELPRMVLEPGECLLIRASGKESAAGEICTPFKLRAKADDVYLINPQNRIVSHVNWTNLKEDEALSRLDDGSYSRALPPSPGYGNEEGNGSALYGSDTVPLSQNDKALYINEIICSSSVGDWIEIYNDSSAAADLGGWWLSDNPKHIHKWEFPAGSTVPAKGYLCVLLIPEGTTSEYSPACDEFRLSKLGGETVSLTPPEGEVLDRVELQAQRSGVSYGRSQETGTYRYFTTPTPNEKNKGDNYAGITADVEISHAGGWIGESSITVSMTVPRDATVYYTTDGSEPDRNSKTYSQPIVIKEDTVVKAIAAKKDCLPSYSVARTYLFGEPSTLRTVCVSGSASELTSSSSGVLRTGGRYPRAVYLEVYDYDGTPMVMQGCELMTQGRSSRVNEHYKQKAFKLIAKNSYGNAGTFKSALFTKRDLDEYNSFMMRASGQDCFDAHMKDSVLTSLLENTKVCYQETELAALYVNGEYWGMYNMRERNDPDTVARKNGWLEDKDDIEIIRGDGGSASQGKPDFYE